MDPLIRFFLFRLIKVLQIILDKILDSLFDASLLYGSRKERLEATSDGRTAQLVRIHAKAIPLSVTLRSEPFHYLFTHIKYVKPDYILKVKKLILLI